MSLYSNVHLIYLPKRNLGQGNISTRVCHSVHKGGACVVAGVLLTSFQACIYAWLWGGIFWGADGCRGQAVCWGVCKTNHLPIIILV